MNRVSFLLVTTLILGLVGCNWTNTAPSTSPTGPQPSSAGASEGPLVRLMGWAEPAPNLLVDTPLTDDVATFAPIANPSWSYPGPGLTMPQPKLQSPVDEQRVLSSIVASIDRTGRPDVPPDVPAALAGVLEGGHYVYKLGGIPKDGADGPLVYMLTRQQDGWEARPICRRAWAWVWPGTVRQTKDPVVVCAYIEGSGANLHLAAYKGDKEVLRVDGLKEGFVEVIAAPDGGMPTIITYGSNHWLNHKADPTVFERYVFTGHNGTYSLSSHERQADWVYHLARLIGFLAKGVPEQALAEFATPPPDGVESYVDRNAPDLPRMTSVPLTSAGKYSAFGAPSQRAYLRPANDELGPWFVFDFDAEGRIRAVAQQKDPPE